MIKLCTYPELSSLSPWKIGIETHVNLNMIIFLIVRLSVMIRKI